MKSALKYSTLVRTLELFTITLAKSNSCFRVTVTRSQPPLAARTNAGSSLLTLEKTLCSLFGTLATTLPFALIKNPIPTVCALWTSALTTSTSSLLELTLPRQFHCGTGLMRPNKAPSAQKFSTTPILSMRTSGSSSIPIITSNLLPTLHLAL